MYKRKNKIYAFFMFVIAFILINCTLLKTEAQQNDSNSNIINNTKIRAIDSSVSVSSFSYNVNKNLEVSFLDDYVREVEAKKLEEEKKKIEEDAKIKAKEKAKRIAEEKEKKLLEEEAKKLEEEKKKEEEAKIIAEEKAKKEEEAKKNAEEKAKNIAKEKSTQEVSNKTRTVSLDTSKSDIDMLARIIEAEAGGEPYSGKLAVGAVVINRTQHESFPNTIKGVIFQEKQFSPISDGRYYSVTVSDDSYKAAKEAISGKDNTKGAVYFYSPKGTSKTWHETLTYTVTIGCHRFFK